MTVDTLQCRICESAYPAIASGICLRCFGPLEPVYDWDAVAKTVSREQIAAGPRSLWRYEALLPVAAPVDAAGGPGWTPLVRAPRLADALGIGELFLKLDHTNPTHSFKDRVVAVAAAKAAELGSDTLACASTGNLGNAVAARAAASGMRSVVSTRRPSSRRSCSRPRSTAARCTPCRGSYDDCSRLVVELAGELDWAFVNVNLRAYYAEGSKTLAFEIAEQLGWELPDAVVAPVASGSLFTKLWQGFEQFGRLGLVEGDSPRIYGGQAEGVRPSRTRSPTSGRCRRCGPRRSPTRWRSALPPTATSRSRPRGRRAGRSTPCPEEDIGPNMSLLAGTTGVFGETAAGVTIGALRAAAASGAIGEQDRVVALVTGSGLKTPQAVDVREGIRIPADVDALLEGLGVHT